MDFRYRVHHPTSNLEHMSEFTQTWPLFLLLYAVFAWIRLPRIITHLFSPGAYQSSRLGSLLEMEVDAQDGLPSIICDKCKRRFEALEKAMHDLTEFRQMAKASLIAFSVRGPIKNKKECSVQTGVSPDIARSRPPLKRITVRRLQYTSMLIKATITINY